ncbi:MAG: aminotransferase class V-fold PLP-dependent enzyme [Candidatus Pacebacteria bacterium]|jgi:cysteine desulfurase|nr:aminotransferase class V-fold PLP-dependent enzyme [Candidatus Paceibacterota bacterium]
MWSRFLRKNNQSSQNRVYLDYAAAAPMTAAAQAAMMPYLTDVFGNPGGIHREGVLAKRALEDFRTQVARVLEVQDTGVVFTSGGTESNNLALRGVVESLRSEGRPYESMTILSTKLEHPATLRALEGLADLGVTVRYLSVNIDGQLDIPSLEEQLDASVVLITLAYINSEAGVITDCRDVRRLLDAVEKKTSQRILLHVDGAQAPLWAPCQLVRIGADLLSLDGGKCGGGKGIGALAMKRGVRIAPLLRGGGQEMGLRPGTEPVHLVAAFATALVEAQSCWQQRTEAVARVRDYSFAEIAKRIPTAVVNGPQGDARVANNVHISIPGIDAEFAVITLDAHGIAASTKSACSSKGGGASTVVLAMTGDETRALSTLRFTLGPDTTTAQIDQMLDVLTKHLSTLKLET